MRAEQLIVHEKEPMRARLTDIVKQKLGSGAAIARESNFEHARELIQRKDRNWSLIVVSETAPVDVRTRIGKPDNNSPACCFVRELRMDRDIPVLGLGRPGSKHLKELLLNWKQTAHAEQHDFPGIEERVDALSNDHQLDPALELEWELNETTNNNLWRIQGHGMSRVDIGPTAFAIDAKKIKILLSTSIALNKSKPKEWVMLLDGVSEQLDELLFNSEQNSELRKVFYSELYKVGGLENLRISFKLTPRWHQAVVEALGGGSDIRQYWMLNAPMVRRFSVRDDLGNGRFNRPPLYSEKKRRDDKVNCLIITADPQYGEIEKGDWAGEYPALKKIRTECDEIAEILAAKKQEVGEVRRIDLGDQDINIQQTVMDALKDKEWHIVHFAGHGVIGSHEKPGLVLSARHGEVMPFENLANALRGTQFLFVSSCRSADPAFIGGAIAFSIPAVIGYRWPVDDNDAAECANAFYTALFTRGHTYKSLEQALLRARNRALDYNAAGNTWASPVLLTQTLARAAA